MAEPDRSRQEVMTQDGPRTPLLDFARELNPADGALGVDVPFALTSEATPPALEQLTLFGDETP